LIKQICIGKAGLEAKELNANQHPQCHRPKIPSRPAAARVFCHKKVNNVIRLLGTVEESGLEFAMPHLPE